MSVSVAAPSPALYRDVEWFIPKPGALRATQSSATNFLLGLEGSDVEQFPSLLRWGGYSSLSATTKQLRQVARPAAGKSETFGLAGKQDQRFPPRWGWRRAGFDGIFNADYPCSSDANDIPVHTRPCETKKLKCCVKLAGPPLLSCFIRIGISTV